MAKGNREIELKFTAHSLKKNDVFTADHVFEKLSKEFTKLKLAARKLHSQTSSDIYWHGKRGGRANFVRVRTNPTIGGEVTVKTKDHATNEDRVEKDLYVKDPVQAASVLEELLGPSAATVTKTYSIILNKESGESVSVYEVEGDKKRRIFVEAETISKIRLKKLCKIVKTSLRKAGIDLKLHKGSIYETFVQTR